MLDMNLPLIEAEFALHWLKPRSKAPVEARWSDAPRYPADQLRGSRRDGMNIGVRLGEPSKVCGYYLQVIDVDIRGASLTHEAMAALRQFAPDFESYPTVQSGSGGASRHFYFLSDRPFRSKKLAHSAEKITDKDGKEHWAWEVELFGTGKQVVLPPSIHPSGGVYKWLREFDFEALDLGLGPIIDSAVVATWVPDAIVQTKGGDDDDLIGLAHSLPGDFTDEQITETLALLPLAEWCEDRDGWLQVGMALHHQFEGAEAGYDRWVAFSKQSPKFNPKDQLRVWRSFEPKPGGVRFATLRQAAAIERERRAEQALGQTPPAIALAGPGGDIFWSRRLAEHYRGGFVHVLPNGGWRRWDGLHWAPCSQGEEIEAAKAFAGKMFEETCAAYRRSETEQDKKLHGDAQGLFKSARRLKSTLEMASTDPSIVVSPVDFDTDTMLLGVANGVLCLRRGALIPPAPEQMISRQSGAAFDPTSTAPQWEAYLDRVLPDDEIRRFVQRAVGYTLTGSVDEERLFFLHGRGANGKSVLGNVLSALLGSFAVTVGSKLLTKSFNSGEADRLVTVLPGARLALASETAVDDLWDSQRVKTLASREPIAARALYQNPFSFFPTQKLWVLGNHLPGVLDNGDGFWRRLVPIPFTVQIPEVERIPDLDRRIVAAELSGVLNWALLGCQDWQAVGLAIPPQITRETKDYRDQTDMVGQWLSECVEHDANGRLAISTAFESYRGYCDGQNVKAPSMMSFSRQMTARGHGVAGSKKQGRKIPGLRLTAYQLDDIDAIE
jgi:putative DNA primase/helicase